MTRSTLSFDSAVATGRGDDGTTGLLFGGDRVRKDDLRTEAYGTVDEAVAALGMARAELGMKAQYGALSPNLGGLGEVILRLQRELFAVGAELATNPDASRPPAGRRDPRVRARWSTAWTRCCARPRPPSSCRASSSSPGESRLSAALEVARTVIRRAERRTVTLAAADAAFTDSLILPYLNRLADLLWILARVAEQAEARQSTVARPSRARGRSNAASPERSES